MHTAVSDNGMLLLAAHISGATRHFEAQRAKPLEAYRVEQLERMKLNSYGFDPSYHVARYNFVYKVPHSWTPLHLALHRREDWPGQHACPDRKCTPANTGFQR